MDVTRHLTEGHELNEEFNRPVLKHGKEWYGYWGNKCPDCNQPAEFDEQLKTKETK